VGNFRGEFLLIAMTTHKFRIPYDEYRRRRRALRKAQEQKWAKEAEEKRQQELAWAEQSEKGNYVFDFPCRSS